MKKYPLPVLCAFVLLSCASATAQTTGQLQKRIVRLERQIAALLKSTNTVVTGLDEVEDKANQAVSDADRANRRANEVDEEVDLLNIPVSDILAGVVRAGVRPGTRELKGKRFVFGGGNSTEVDCTMIFTEYQGDYGTGDFVATPHDCTFAGTPPNEEIRGRYRVFDDTIMLFNVVGGNYVNGNIVLDAKVRNGKIELRSPTSYKTFTAPLR